MSGLQQNYVAQSRCYVLQLLPASGEVSWDPGSLQDLCRDGNHREEGEKRRLPLGLVGHFCCKTQLLKRGTEPGMPGMAGDVCRATVLLFSMWKLIKMWDWP